MSTKRQWDESRSPQWKYLLQKESRKKRGQRKKNEKEEDTNYLTSSSTSSEDEQLLYPQYRQRALTKAERRERRVQQLKKEYENSK